MPKRKFSFVVTFWWMLGCLMLGCFLCAFAPKESRASDSENRMLAGFPPLTGESVLNCGFMNGLESFLSDGFFGRDAVIAGANAALGLLDRRTEADRLLPDKAALEELTGLPQTEGDGFAQPENSTDDDWDTPPDDGWDEPLDDEWGDETDGDWTENGDENADDSWDEAGRTDRPKALMTARRYRALAAAPGSEAPLGGSLFMDDSLPVTAAPREAFDPSVSYSLWLERADGARDSLEDYPVKSIEYTAETLRLYREALPEDGTVHYVNVPPSTFAEKLLKGRTYASWGSDMENGLNALVPEGVYVYNVSGILEKHILAGEPVYMTIDHHWTPLGAHYVCAEMLRAQGLPVLPYDEYAYQTYPSVTGPENSVDTISLLEPLLPLRSLLVAKRVKEKELSFMDNETRTYRAYLNGTRMPWRRIVTGFHSGRKALVVCDSFGNAFAPYLTPYYDEVHMTDPRAKHYSKAQAGGSISELIAYYGIDDVYIVVCSYNGVNMKTSCQAQRANFLP